MQAILTRYCGPTNTQGARISASAQAGRKMIAWDYALDVNDNHAAAAKAFADSLGWLNDGDTLATGFLPNGDAAHVIVHAVPRGKFAGMVNA